MTIQAPVVTGMSTPPRLLAGIWAAVATPFRDNGDLDLEGISTNAERFWRELGIDGIFCNGLIGELWALTIAERKEILEATLAGAKKKMHVGVVVNAQNLNDTLDLAAHASRLGTHHIILMRPAGYICHDEIERYVRSVSEACDAPIILFDGGSHTGRFADELVTSLAAGGHIHGVKCTRGNDSASTLRAICSESMSVTDPYESQWLTNLLRFDLRVLYADPEPYLFQLPQKRLISDYFEAYKNGDLGEAARLFRTLEPIRSVYQRWIMHPLRDGKPVNAIVKRWLKHLGFATGPVRTPLVPLDEERASAFDQELLNAFRQVYGQHFTFDT